MYMRKVCHNTPNLEVYQDEVTLFSKNGNEVYGVKN